MLRSSLPFTAADSTRWTDYAFTKIVGTTSVLDMIAVISGNKGHGRPGVGNEVGIYLANIVSGLRDYTAKVTLVWDNAVGAGREAGLGVRAGGAGSLTGLGESGYYAVVDSNLNDPKVKLVRRNAGSEQVLVGYTSMAPLTGASLNGGITLELRVQTLANSSVSLTVKVGANTFITHNDSSSLAITDGQGLSLYHGLTTRLTDVIFDDLEAHDFETETLTNDWQTGVALIRNGVYLNQDELQALGIVVSSATRSYDGTGSVASLYETNPAGAPVLVAGDWVEVVYGGVWLASGVLRRRQQSFPPPENIVWDVVGAKALAAEVPIEDPITTSGFISFNFDEDSEFYHPQRADKTIGEMIQAIIDEHLTGQDGLRNHRAVAPSGTPYVVGDFATLTAKIPHVTISGTVTQAIETLLSFMPDHAWDVDPQTRAYRFHKRSVSPTSTLDTADHHLGPDITLDLDRASTAIIVRGSKPDAEDLEFIFDRDNIGGSTLQPAWDPALESYWRTDDQWREGISLVVTSVSTIFEDAATRLVVNVDISGGERVVPNEWTSVKATFVGGPQAGNIYVIKRNTPSSFILFAGAWIGGTPPNPGDVFQPSAKISGSGANNLNSVYKHYELKDHVLAKPPCSLLDIQDIDPDTDESKSYAAKVAAIGNAIASGNSLIKAELPTIGLFNRLGTDPCGSQNPVGAAKQVKITLPVYPTATGAANPKIRVPTQGFRGTAFSYDSGRWNGAGTYRPGVDHGSVTPKVIEIPEFVSFDLQGAEYITMADSLLEVYGSVPYEGKIDLWGELNVSFAGLDKKIRLTDSINPSRPTGLESSDDLWLIGVTWNFLDHDTSLQIGTLSAEGIDIEAMRRRYAEKTRLDSLRRMRALAEEVRNCLAASLQGGAGAGPDSPTPICADRVSYTPTYNPPIPNPSPRLPQKLTKKLGTVQNALGGIIWIKSKQKGVQIQIDEDSGVIFVLKGGVYYWYDDKDKKWRRSSAGLGDRTDSDVEDNPFKPDPPGPTPNPGGPFPEGSWYAQLYDALAQLAKNMGKSIEFEVDSDGLPQSITVKKSGAAASNDPAKPTEYHPPCSPPVKLPTDGSGEVPSNVLTQIHAAFGVGIGLSIHSINDIGGVVYATPSGSLFRAKSNTAGTYADGAVFEEVENVGAGNGLNGGSFAPVTVNPVTLKPTIHKQFQTGERGAQPGSGPVVAGNDGEGVLLGAGGVTGFETEQLSLPTNYAQDDPIRVTVTYRSQGGAGTGNFRVSVLSENTGQGSTPFGLSTLTDKTIPNPGANGETSTFTVDVPPDTLATGGGGRLSMGMKRDTNHGDDLNPDDLVIVGMDADVPVESPLVEVA